MKALHGGRSREFQLDYHRGRWAPEFDKEQPGRVNLARTMVESILKDLPHRPLRIVELGCGAGDVSGFYCGGVVRGSIDTTGIEVIGVDVVPDAQEKCNRRWPAMTFLLSSVEELVPMDCDLLVLTEFLEHVADPRSIVDAWMPKARWALIGHPLDEPDPPFEFGHAWSYSEADWDDWFLRYGFVVSSRSKFPMGAYEMIMGYGSRQ